MGIDIDVFQRRYLIHAASQVPNRAPGELRECAHHHLALGRVRQPGQLLIQADDYDGDTTEIDIVTEDAPFLIDSIRAELDREGITIQYILHPQLVVRRDSAGELTEVFDIEDNAEVPAEATAEAWIHIEVDLVAQDRLDALVAELSRVLADVQYAVADRPQMYDADARTGRRAWSPIRASSTARPAPRRASCCAGWPPATTWCSATRRTRPTSWRCPGCRPRPTRRACSAAPARSRRSS